MAFENLLQVVAHCDKFPYHIDLEHKDEIHHVVPLCLGPHVIGNILPSVLPHLKQYNDSQSPAPFVIASNVTFASWVDSFEKRTQVVKQLMDTWRAQTVFSALAGWRNELYPVYGDSSRVDNVAFVMERAATPLFGISTFGVHLNAYVRDQDNDIKMWVARRALTKPTWPGLLDNCVAGGISYKYSTKETIVKECDEEASIPADLAVKAQNASCVSYYTYTEHGLQPETQYIFDLALPAHFTPTPRDGEVQCFYLWPMDKVKETILNGEWKPNCALVAIDFMIRHGMINADEEPDYIEISYRLHRRLPFPTPKKGAQ
ncbi:NUDIX hydrolase domain-like protein [Radiomyces spectabilis]|uniref:NUDIX hydrolase domain-like protein n=1 Tax=Radiomyces spectabilis TaxID=64574 RepID=UPI00221F89CD|nr:NUDIX hydrolase domain-like protein [Radiomyces spectabilis]KAI8379362.1 NUDIX hydrolase domain-like protein [Radiomyces spectabilis]